MPSQHLFFCKESHCDNEVFESGTLCGWCAHPCTACGCTVEFRHGELVCGCDTCKMNGCVYGSVENEESLRDLAEGFYLGNCYAETDEGYDAACRWYDGELGDIDEKTRSSLLVTLKRWHSCSGEIDYERGIKVCDDHPPKRCMDCGERPTDCYFPCYRGEDPLCAHCEEAAFGRPPDDWREMTGRCMTCKFLYNLTCSSDRKDLCRKCQ